MMQVDFYGNWWKDCVLHPGVSWSFTIQSIFTFKDKDPFTLSKSLWWHTEAWESKPEEFAEIIE